jgi:hypothetical protein
VSNDEAGTAAPGSAAPDIDTEVSTSSGMLRVRDMGEVDKWAGVVAERSDGLRGDPDFRGLRAGRGGLELYEITR